MITISKELQEKLKNCKSDVEFSKMLADNSVNVEEYEKSLPDDVLEKIGGGFVNYNDDRVYCPWCDNAEEAEISYQVLVSIYHCEDIYRCRKCNGFFKSEKGKRGDAVPIKLYWDPNAIFEW